MTICIGHFKGKTSEEEHAFTLVEFMVALTIFGMLAGGLSSCFLVFLKSTMGLGNYADMTVQSQQFLERFGREMRMAKDVWIASENQISIDIPTDIGTKTIDYFFDPDTKKIIREFNEVERPVLSNVEDFNLNYYNLQGNMTTSLLEIKEIQLEANLLKNVLYIENNNEFVSARFLMRNRKVAN